MQRRANGAVPEMIRRHLATRSKAWSWATPYDIATALGLSCGSVTGAVKAMVERGELKVVTQHPLRVELPVEMP